MQQQRQAEQEQGDTFSIYQLKRGDETRDLRFEPYDRLQATGHTVDRANYELVYTAPLTKDMTLGDIWEKFNIDHPADFKGHSLSVSDIVVLHQNGENTAHYVDSIGFQQVPEFLQEQQTPVFDKLPPEQQQALSDTVKDTLQMLVDAEDVYKRQGLYNTGRLGAQGLYNISTRVSNPQPGDLVFFTGTYDTPGVSHVGIYVGEDGDGSPVMLHCGDPIQYTSSPT